MKEPPPAASKAPSGPQFEAWLWQSRDPGAPVRAKHTSEIAPFCAEDSAKELSGPVGHPRGPGGVRLRHAHNPPKKYNRPAAMPAVPFEEERTEKSVVSGNEDGVHGEGVPEARVDPESGRAFTFSALLEHYQGTYSAPHIQGYWTHDMQPFGEESIPRDWAEVERLPAAAQPLLVGNALYARLVSAFGAKEAGIHTGTLLFRLGAPALISALWDRRFCLECSKDLDPAPPGSTQAELWGTKRPLPGPSKHTLAKRAWGSLRFGAGH